MLHINEKRIRKLNKESYTTGPVVYLMQRDQRVLENWALIHSINLAHQHKTNVFVIFQLNNFAHGENERQKYFMYESLKELSDEFYNLNIPFHCIGGHTSKEIVHFLQESKVGALVTDFNPLKPVRQYKNELVERIDFPVYEVDAHNIVPVWIVSPKEEYSAYTLRRKISPMLNEFLDTYPEISPLENNVQKLQVSQELVITPTLNPNRIDFPKSGCEAGNNRLDEFIASGSDSYAEKRNNPNSEATSGLSPYLHFGQISSQTIALRIIRDWPENESRESFLDELIVRKELSDNFCYYNPDYDTYEGFREWAKKSLEKHKIDEREYSYTPQELEQAVTHDQLWNSAQKQMVNSGQMHGYMRMYWAKKILEWTSSPESALEIAVQLNDKYSLDGNDPNGYAGCAWSIGGVHDRPWQERPVFGQIRYMNYNGCRRKFNVEEYIQSVSQIQ